MGLHAVLEVVEGGIRVFLTVLPTKPIKDVRNCIGPQRLMAVRKCSIDLLRRISTVFVEQVSLGMKWKVHGTLVGMARMSVLGDVHLFPASLCDG